jgi:hypothetical protein
VEALMSERDVLPARFGGVLEGEEAVRELLSDRAAELNDALVHVAGSVELAVRALLPEAASSDPGEGAVSGTAYLAAAGERRRRLHALGETLEEELGPLARETRIRFPRADPPSISAAFLVARERVASFAARVDELDEQLTGAELVCTGPWPPYSFVAPVAAA